MFSFCGHSLKNTVLGIYIEITVDFQKSDLKTTLRCTESGCTKTFNSVYNYQLHMRCHRQDFKFMCSVCGKGFINRNHYSTHCDTHTDSKKHECTNCQKKFITKSSCKRHMKSCSVMSKSFECGVCGKYFKTVVTLKKHQKNVHI